MVLPVDGAAEGDVGVRRRPDELDEDGGRKLRRRAARAVVDELEVTKEREQQLDVQRGAEGIDNLAQHAVRQDGGAVVLAPAVRHREHVHVRELVVSETAVRCEPAGIRALER